ncbi:hypothetical protein AALB39_27020 [Lachnospiraceae bacterium 54-53]
MFLNKLFEAIEIPMAVRNVMVDYCDCKGNFYHKPLQTVCPLEVVETDTEFIKRIKEEIRQQGFSVCGIHEVIGDFEMKELEEIFNGSGFGKYPMRTIYIDIDKAMR